jgi:hypothetical protein
MGLQSSWFASELRRELGLRNRLWARGRAHVESYGNPPVIVYPPNHPTDEDLSVRTPRKSVRHGNFFDPAYAAIAARPEWMRRFDKIHAQGRSLPKADSGRRWRELDSSMSSDALLMNVFCTPGVVEAAAVRQTLGVDGEDSPIFGWKARVPLKSGRFDRTEVDMRWGDLLVEAKLTESDFQTRADAVVEAYRDFDAVFDRELLPRVQLATKRRREAAEFPEDYSQEAEQTAEELDLEGGGGFNPRTKPAQSTWALQTAEERFALKGHDFSRAVSVAKSTLALAPEERFPPIPLEILNSSVAFEAAAPDAGDSVKTSSPTTGESGYAGYQLIRNVLAAYSHGCSFCVIHDQRRPDLREAWFEVMAAVKSADIRVRLKVLTWQELAAMLPEGLQGFLDLKYGIVPPGRVASPAEETAEFE